MTSRVQGTFTAAGQSDPIDGRVIDIAMRFGGSTSAFMQNTDPSMPDRDEDTGHFLPGNQFWLARSSHGPKPKFSNPGDLWAACCEYFQWAEDNPLWEDRLVSFQGVTKHEPVAKMRAMTTAGLCLFLDISQDTWIEWRKTRSDLSEVISRAEDVIRSQKFAGAAADLLNANIISRDLGLVEKSERKETLTLGTYSEEQLESRLAELLGKEGSGGDPGGDEPA